MAEIAQVKSRDLCEDRAKVRQCQVNLEFSGQGKHKRRLNTDPAMGDMACPSVLCNQISQKSMREYHIYKQRQE